MDALKSRISTLQDLIPTKIASIEEADRKQGLFSDQSAKPCPQLLPTYSGNPRDYLITFKDKFEVAEDNRI